MGEKLLSLKAFQLMAISGIRTLGTTYQTRFSTISVFVKDPVHIPQSCKTSSKTEMSISLRHNVLLQN